MEKWIWHGKVRYYETDRMGVVHHANYLRILENARLDWLDAMGMCYSQMEKAGVIIPCVSATGRFLEFLRYDDHYQVAICLKSYSGVRLSFSYEIFNERTGRLSYQGESEHYFARDGDYLPVRLAKKLPEHDRKFRELLAGTGE